MVYNYLYIDDADFALTGGTVNGLRENYVLEIEFKNPLGKWEDQRADLQKETFSKKYNGLILDLRLEDYKNTDGEIAKYKGTSLAQELRTLMKEGLIKEIPIVLLSATQYLNESFDKTGKDLFDLVIPKESLNGDEFQVKRHQLVGLAAGYNTVNVSNRENIQHVINGIIGVAEDGIDIRFISKLYSIATSPTHEIASFILKNLILKEGLLITELTMAARLGIDIEKSSDWKDLKDVLINGRYTGIFNEGWDRWWMHKLNLWWTENFNDHSLRQTSAENKVDLIRKFTNLSDLTPVKPVDMAKSDKFWTICVGTKKPIDTIDGLLIDNQDDLFPWQDRQYVSYEAALSRLNVNIWKGVSPFESNKLLQLQTLYSRERVRR